MTHDLTTFDGALAAIAALPCTWSRDAIGRIRTRRDDGRDACPVCELEPTHSWFAQFGAAADMIGMPRYIADRIADAADNPDHPDRAALEIACKLRERAP